MLDQLFGQAVEEVLNRVVPPELLPPGTHFAPQPPPARVPQPPSSPPSSYSILGVSPGDPQDLIEAVWRAKAKYYHPDVPTGNVDKFQQLKQAYDAIRQERGHVHG